MAWTSEKLTHFEEERKTFGSQSLVVANYCFGVR